MIESRAPERTPSFLLLSSLLLLGLTLVSPASAAAQGSPDEPESYVWTNPVTGIQEFYLEGQATASVTTLLFGSGIAEIGDTGAAAAS